jgi:cyclopropane fatty-acyl-phospholipid synthase-like methyltransferase
MATAEQVREHYDSLAFVYRTYWGEHIHHGLFERGDEPAEVAQVMMLAHCMDLLQLRGGETVLDAGCGHGGTLLHLAQVLGCCGTGITISPKQAKLAQENARKADLQSLVKFVVEDVHLFEYPAAAFDLAWTMESTEHFIEKAEVFGKIASALRPQGKWLLAAWTGSMEKPRVRQVAKEFLCPELWTPEQYKSALKSAGLTIIYSEDLTAKVIRTWEICQQHARLASPIVKLLPQAVREFVGGIDTILDAYRSGDLSYTVLVAQK